MTYKYPNPQNPFDMTSDVPALLNAILFGGKCLQYSKLTITGPAKSFANAVAAGFGVAGIPPGAMSALCVLEADAAQVNAPRVCRFRYEDAATLPTANDGMPVGDNGTFEINGTDNIANFDIIGIVGGNTHTLHITWFGANG